MTHSSTFHDIVQHFEPFLSKELCPQAYWEEIIRIARLFPMLSQGMFEVRLGDSKSQVDFGILMVRKWGEMDLLLDFYENHPEALQASRLHETSVLEICKQTTRGDGLLAQTLQNIWVAFDLDDQEVPHPYVYFVTGPLPFTPEITLSVTKQILLQYGNRITDQQYSTSLKLLETLPAEVKLEAFGFFENRQRNLLRLALRSFNSLESLTAYLGGIKAPEVKASKHNELLESLFDASDSVQILLDVGDTLKPRIGLEFWLDRDQNPEQCIKMLNLLVGNKLCSSPKQTQLMHWISLPGNPAKKSHQRWINHIKITLEPGKPPQSKIDLSFSSSMP